MSEIEQRLEQNNRQQRLVSTVAKRHRDAGVDELCDLLTKIKASAEPSSDEPKGRARRR
jgi:hypothetical protein